MTDNLKRKRRIKAIDFSHEGASVALTSKSLNNGPANGWDVLLTKGVSDISEEDLAKAHDVQVNMSFCDFLERFFGMYYTEAKMLARLLGYDIEEEGDQEVTETSYTDFIDERISNITLLKQAEDAADADTFLKSLKPEQVLELLKAQEQFEKAVEQEGTLSVDDYAFVPDTESPDTWKFRIDNPVNTKNSVDILSKSEDIPDSMLESIKQKLSSAFKKFFPDKDLPEVITKSAEENNQLGENPEMTIDELMKSAEFETLMAEKLEKAKEEGRAERQEEVDTVLADLAKAQGEVAELRKEKEDAIKAARQERLVKAVGEEKAEVIFKSLESLDEEAFDTVVKGYEDQVSALEESNLTKEVGVNGEGTSDEDDATAKYLREKYSK